MEIKLCIGIFSMSLRWCSVVAWDKFVSTILQKVSQIRLGRLEVLTHELLEFNGFNSGRDKMNLDFHDPTLG